MKVRRLEVIGAALALSADERSGSDGPTQDAGEAKVTQLDDAGLGEEDVLWLYVPVDALQTQTGSGLLQHDGAFTKR